MALVVDTGPLVAAINKNDRDHEACVALFEESGERCVIPAPVLVEVDYFCGLIHPAAFPTLLEDIEDGVFDVLPLVTSDYRRVRELLIQYADLRVGFVDAAVLTTAERLGERKLATLDRRQFSVMQTIDGPLDLIPS